MLGKNPTVCALSVHSNPACLYTLNASRVWPGVYTLRTKNNTMDISVALSIKRMLYSKIGSFQKRENSYVQFLGLETVNNTVREMETLKLWFWTCSTAVFPHHTPAICVVKVVDSFLPYATLPGRYRHGNGLAVQSSLCDLKKTTWLLPLKLGTLGIFLQSQCFYKDLKGSLIFSNIQKLYCLYSQAKSE